MGSNHYITDRTTAEMDDRCGMSRYWYKEHAEGGIVKASEEIFFQVGRDIHDDLARIASGERWEDVAGSIPPADPHNMLTAEPTLRRVGWVVAFGSYLWPLISKEWDPIMVEKEVILDRDPLWVAATADLVLRHRVERSRVKQIDYKSVGMLTKGWVTHWPYAIQRHVNIAAVGEELNERVENETIIGLAKGFEKDGKLRHPYVWAYSDGSKWSGDWVRGWELRSVSEYPGGVAEWVHYLGESVALEQFPHSAPIVLNDRLLARWVSQRTFRERMIQAWREAGRPEKAIPTLFPAAYEACRPVVGFECPYLAACHNATISDDPIASGLYVKRTPHHDVEIVGVE